MKRIRLTKVAELTDAEVPNNIPVGYYKEGTMYYGPQVGMSFWLTEITNVNGRDVFAKLGRTFTTSPVREIIDEHTFDTLNSRYKITEI